VIKEITTYENSTYQLLNKRKHINTLFSLNFKLRLRPAIFILFSVITFISFSQQNLVLNGDMEDFSTCPNGYSDPTQNPKEIEKCIGWKAPTYGTSDFFNICATGTNVDVPNNTLGQQDPFNGEGYLGAYFCGYRGGSGIDGYQGIMWWEYVQGKTIIPLEQGKIYKLSMEVSLAEYSDLMINQFGAYFSDFPITSPNSKSLNVVPQCVFNYSGFFKDTLNWMHVESFFLAYGGEKFLTIGNFKDSSSTDTLRRYFFDPFYLSPFLSYFYIDHVVLTEADVDISNVFTPNNDGINDQWVLPFSGNETNKVSILNRWGNVIYEAELIGFQWDGKTIDGKEVSDGSYFYKISNTNIAGFIELIR
jgi:gliding motility-associated-like protein